MRFFRYIFIFIAAAFAAGCSGARDDSSLPVLEVSSAEIDLATESSVEFTVTYDGRDVTSESTFFMNPSTRTEDSVGPVFYPESVGSYSFVAVYDGKESNSVTVNVVNSDVAVESKYERHVNIIEFTGAWCINCPDGFKKMMLTLSKPSMAKYVDYIHMCAFHSNLEGGDSMAIPATQDVFKLFKGLAYPSFVTDLRNVEGSFGILTDDGSANFQPSIIASFEDYPAHCGVAVSSSLNASKTETVVNVKVASELTSDYRVIVLVVEDKVKAPDTPQKAPLYQNGDPDYIHSHVVRKVVTSYSGTFTGEKLTDDGKIKAGAEASKSWTLPLDGKWNLANTELYALVLDSDGYVNNMNVCPIENGSSDYRIKK